MKLIRVGRKFPVGVDSFRCLVLQDFTFVDKSLLILEFITASDKVSLILRPRRFGKSMNLDMLRYRFIMSYSDTFSSWFLCKLLILATDGTCLKACSLMTTRDSLIHILQSIPVFISL